VFYNFARVFRSFHISFPKSTTSTSKLLHNLFYNAMTLLLELGELATELSRLGRVGAEVGEAGAELGVEGVEIGAGIGEGGAVAEGGAAAAEFDATAARLAEQDGAAMAGKIHRSACSILSI
jgi:hypothetical protein